LIGINFIFAFGKRVMTYPFAEDAAEIFRSSLSIGEKLCFGAREKRQSIRRVSPNSSTLDSQAKGVESLR
jgi:hypothetical protein